MPYYLCTLLSDSAGERDYVVRAVDEREGLALVKEQFPEEDLADPGREVEVRRVVEEDLEGALSEEDIEIASRGIPIRAD